MPWRAGSRPAVRHHLWPPLQIPESRGEDGMPVPGHENHDENMVPASVDVLVSCHAIKYAGLVLLRYNYRLDPWPRHRDAFGKAFGCARVVFNDGLAARREAHEAGQPYVTDAEL